MYHNRKALRKVVKSNPPPPNNWKAVRSPWHFTEKLAVFGIVVALMLLYEIFRGS